MLFYLFINLSLSVSHWISRVFISVSLCLFPCCCSLYRRLQDLTATQFMHFLKQFFAFLSSLYFSKLYFSLQSSALLYLLHFSSHLPTLSFTFSLHFLLSCASLCTFTYWALSFSFPLHFLSLPPPASHSCQPLPLSLPRPPSLLTVTSAVCSSSQSLLQMVAQPGPM